MSTLSDDVTNSYEQWKDRIENAKEILDKNHINYFGVGNGSIDFHESVVIPPGIEKVLLDIGFGIERMR